jgi:hypothetical protein
MKKKKGENGNFPFGKGVSDLLFERWVRVLVAAFNTQNLNGIQLLR